MHKCEFGQAHYVELLNRSPTKFSLPFLNIHTSFYEFWKFELFLLFKTNGNDFKNPGTVLGPVWPKATAHGRGDLPCTVAG
jgi:hypothetical protein